MTMRTPLLLFAFVPLLALLAFAAQPVAPPTDTAADNMRIFCTNGGDFSASSALFRGDVRVIDPQMYLECELLTVYFQTNNASGAASSTNVSARIEQIIAETNLLMIARETTIIGDRAVYTASNEVMIITGELVIIETDKSYTYGQRFVFDRRSGKGSAVGPTVVELKTTGTNSIKSGFGPLRRPASEPKPKPDAPK